MKQWKKYLAAVGAAALILVLGLSIKNNGNKTETDLVKNSTMVQENLQTEVEPASDENETISTLSAEEKQTSDDKNVNQEQSISEDDIKSEINNLINTYYDSLGDEKKDSLDTKDQTADDKSVKKQTSGEKKSENDIIEKYQDIKTYIKPGLDKNSYVVFTTYNIKLYNIDTLVPGMSSMVISRDKEGNLSINPDQNNKKLNDYINKLSKEKDIKKVINDINSKLAKAVKKDTSLQGFMDYLK
ncbi:hypothetical protein Ana3638_14865 [Anaerocolumna sedimenticola]|uniref:Uncharacterized protein n=1 Tax=Anaerocolumna sedimenticola TaxID=2696063 RepID=A0A6P1TQT8_9FIRM|nr:hypothetical protein [Anaerocolumna sedimenticola]QHQ61905.1 hypothetical protein Ana3638_14865 [Anaerocolumna sedimenticola]